MTEQMSETPREAVTWRKTIWQSVIGAAVGGGGTIGAISLLERGDGPGLDISQLILVGVGLIYALVALFVAIGALAPRSIGQHLLNVADAEELEDDRAMLVYSALGCFAMGASLVLLALAATGDPIAPFGPAMAFWVFLAMLAGIAVVSVIMWRGFDELWRQLTIDAYALTGQFLLLVLALWGGAAAGNLIQGPQPLDLVSLAFGGMLLATFLAVGRRGMATPS